MRPFQQQQAAFAARIRDPLHQPLPAGVERERMRVYEELFYNNLDELLSANFPVLREVLADDWPGLVRAFMQDHRCQTPLFAEIPRELLAFLHERADSLALPGFVEELAHYEWVEMALAGAREDLHVARARAGVGRQQDVMSGVPLLSPLAWLLSYQWPVHLISRDFQPENPLETPLWLLVWRDGSLQVQFAWVNETVVWLLQQMEQGRHTGDELANRLAAHLQRQDGHKLREYTRALLQDYLQRDVLLGVKEGESA